MKNLIKIFTFSLLAFLTIYFITGCGAVRENLIKISDEDLANAETSRIVSKNLLKTWPINSGFIKGSLGDNINQFPLEFIKAIKELDDLSDKKEWSDFEMGYSLGLRIRLLSKIIHNTLKQYAPDILKYLPLIL